MPMVSFRVSEETWARLNAACGSNRSAWLVRALEQALGDPGLRDEAGVQDAPPSVPARAPTGKPVAGESDPGLTGVDRVMAFRRYEALRRAGK